MIERFELQAGRWGVEMRSEQVGEMSRFARLLVSYDRANVTAAKTFSEALIDQVLDSLSCYLAASLRGADNLIDVGSGGGLPGLPLKLALPALDVTLLEATGKKVEFLRHVIEVLEISGARAVAERAENLGQDPRHRERYAIATARAVAQLSVLAEYCLPLARPGGAVIAMKGRLDGEELEAGRRASEQLGGSVSEVIEVGFIPQIPEKQRRLVVIEKVHRTPHQYPRKPGKPGKRPLGSFG